MASFDTEKDGQLDFFRTFLPRVNPSLGIDEIIADGNDGVINGNLLEFKTRLDDLNAALSQSIKYLSARRLKGKPVPANIVIISLEESTAYIYSSTLYLHAIEKVYSGPLSKNNAGFTAGKFRERLDYSMQSDWLAYSKATSTRESTSTRTASWDGPRSTTGSGLAPEKSISSAIPRANTE